MKNNVLAIKFYPILLSLVVAGISSAAAESLLDKAATPAPALPPTSTNSGLPASLLLDDATTAAIQQCLDNDFTQRLQALITDDAALQQENASIDNYKADIINAKQNLDQQEALLNSFARSQSKMASDLDVLRSSLYRSHATKPLSAEQILVENNKIEAYNKMSGEFNAQTDQYNKLVVAQKRRITDYNALAAALNDTVAKYNAHALVIVTPTNQLLRDVASYQSKCASQVKK